MHFKMDSLEVWVILTFVYSSRVQIRRGDQDYIDSSTRGLTEYIGLSDAVVDPFLLHIY
jgi:hypothetical protein